MEYATKVKRIGGSAYLLLPPKLARNYGFKDNSEVLLRELDKMVVVETNRARIDKAGQDFLNLRFNLGGKGISREEIYEIDRY